MSNENKEIALAPAPTPMEMIHMAIEKGVDTEQLNQLMDLQDRWESKQAHKTFIVAMSKFRSDCPNVNKDKPGVHDIKYATLANTVNTIKGTMEQCGLNHSWVTETTGKSETTEIKVTCIVTHIDGHSEQSSLSAGIDTTGKKSLIQGMGSTVSYLERYTLHAVLGITSEEMDNDGYEKDQVINSDQKEEIIKLIKESGTELKTFLKYMNVRAVDGIPLIKLNKALDGLKKKVKKNATGN